jgi:phosphate/sulfate permease
MDVAVAVVVVVLTALIFDFHQRLPRHGQCHGHRERVSDIQPVQGFAAETTSAAMIVTFTHVGLPLSTTQVCTGSIFGAGAGAGRRLAAVRWGMAGRIMLAWSFTLPAAAVV